MQRRLAPAIVPVEWRSMLNRIGLIVCGVYATFSLLVILMRNPAADVKSLVALEQLAILPYILFVEAMGFRKTVILTPWMNTIPTGFVLSLVLMYLVGCTLSGILRLSGKRDGSGQNKSAGKSHFTTVGQIISEWWAASSRNRGRIPPRIRKPGEE